jgi:hypothetical protein
MLAVPGSFPPPHENSLFLKSGNNSWTAFVNYFIKKSKMPRKKSQLTFFVSGVIHKKSFSMRF